MTKESSAPPPGADAPRPWHHVKTFRGVPLNPLRSLIGADSVVIGETCAPRALANADLIVRAVNAHDALVAALRRYGRHETLCAVTGGYDYGCTCGFSAVLAAGDTPEGRTP